MKHQSGYAFTLLLLLAGCGGGDSSSDESGTTQLNLAISDAPVDSAQQVCIAVSGLRLKQEGVDTDTVWGPLSLINSDNNPDYSNNDDCLPDGYTIPTDENGNPEFFYLDLLKYQNGDKHMLLSNAVIPSGSYEQLRLQVEDGRISYLGVTTGTDAEYPASYVKETDGTILPLEVPSSELKFQLSDVPTSGVLDYQVEFNLRHAMVLPGHEEYYKLKPNGVELLDVDVLSTISGTVAASDVNCGTTALSNGDVGVYLYNAGTTTYNGIDYDTAQNGPVLSTLVSGAEGTYTYQINYVEAGTYDLALVCNAAGDELTEIGNSSAYPIEVATPVKEDIQVPEGVAVTADFY